MLAKDELVRKVEARRFEGEISVWDSLTLGKMISGFFLRRISPRILVSSPMLHNLRPCELAVQLDWLFLTNEAPT